MADFSSISMTKSSDPHACGSCTIATGTRCWTHYWASNLCADYRAFLKGVDVEDEGKEGKEGDDELEGKAQPYEEEDIDEEGNENAFLEEEEGEEGEEDVDFSSNEEIIFVQIE